MSNTAKINEYLKKTTDFDASERVMAALDLSREFGTVVGKIDQALQVPVRDAILKLVEDKSGDVKTAAVKFLAETVSKFNAEHVKHIVESLGRFLVERKDTNKRDVADCLKQIIPVLSDDDGKAVSPVVLKSLLLGLNKSFEAETEMEMVCLDVLGDVLSKFGSHVISEQKGVLSAVTKLLEHPDENVRQRASATLGPLVISLDDANFTTLMSLVVEKIEKSKFKDTYIRCISTVCAAAGVRIGDYLPKIVPRLIAYCKQGNTPDQADDAILALWETCLSALGAIINQCPNQVTDHVPQIVPLSLAFIKHDPNYSYDDDGGDDAGAAGGDDDGFGGGDDWGAGGGGGWGESAASTHNQSADDSWKVRRSAVNVLSSFVRVKSDILKPYYERICDDLMARFKERDVNVKEDILLCMRDLLREAYVSDQNAVAEQQQLDIPMFVRQRSSYAMLDDKVSNIVDSVVKEFKSADVRTRKALFAVLSELCVVRQGRLSEFMSKLAPHTTDAITATGKDAEVNSSSLKFLLVVLQFHSYDELKPFIAKFCDSAIQAVTSGGQKDLSQGLGVLAALVSTMQGQPGMEATAKKAYSATLVKLDQKDVPERIKIASISTMGAILASFGSQLSTELPKVLPILAVRMGNETTCQAVLKTLTKMCNSDQKLNLKPILSSIPEMCTFLRKEPNTLRHEAAICLEALVRTQATQLTAADYGAIIKEVATHINDSDLNLSALCLDVVSTSLIVNPAIAPVVSKEIIGKALDFVKSPLLQGRALESLINLFQKVHLAKPKDANLQYLAIQTALLSTVDAKRDKTGINSTALCIAGLSVVAASTERDQTVTKFISDVKSGADHIKQVSLISLGEIGNDIDLSSFTGLESVVLSAFDSKTEGVRSAASFALGNIAVGCMATYLPNLINLIKKKPESMYLLLSSLKETILAHTKDAKTQAVMLPHVSTITPLLLSQCDHKDEGVRGISAECLGRLAIIDPVKLLPELGTSLASTVVTVRASAITALRYSFGSLMQWDSLKPHLKTFLQALNDKDLNVTRQACLTLNSLINANVDILTREHLHDIVFPALYRETKVKPELVEEVDYAAFKVTIDHGLPLRKAAFQCLASLLQFAAKRVDMKEFIVNVKQGLTDLPDIQIFTYEILITIAKQHPSSLLEVLDDFQPILLASLKKSLAESKEKSEGAKDCLRAMFRAMLTFNAMHGVDLAQKYVAFFKSLRATKHPVLDELQKEIPL